MVAFDFDYYKPKTIQEAANLYHTLQDEGKTPLYFSGGTEIITLGRLNILYTDAVIDLNALPGYQTVFSYENFHVIGAGMSLTKLAEDDSFPLLSQTVREIADRTARNKISLGGNICGNIYYREAVLPLLLTDALIGIVKKDGIFYCQINKAFQKEIQLQKGEFLFHILIDKQVLNLPSISIKRRQQWNVGYPLVTVCALKKEGEVRMAFSGVCPFPFRSVQMEDVLNDRQLALEDRVSKSLDFLPGPVLNDVEGSRDYRLFVLKNTILDAMHALEGGQHVYSRYIKHQW